MSLIPFLTQSPCKCNLTGWGSRVYPNDWSSRVYPNRRDSRVYPNGRGSQAWPGRGRRCAWGLCPCGSRYALAAWALPLRFVLRAHGLGFALTTIN